MAVVFYPLKCWDLKNFDLWFLKTLSHKSVLLRPLTRNVRCCILIKYNNYFGWVVFGWRKKNFGSEALWRHSFKYCPPTPLQNKKKKRKLKNVISIIFRLAYVYTQRHHLTLPVPLSITHLFVNSHKIYNRQRFIKLQQPFTHHTLSNDPLFLMHRGTSYTTPIL